MSETSQENSTPVTNLTDKQVAEVSDRPSQAEVISEKDRLPENQTTCFDVDVYKDVQLPQSLQGGEEHFASFKTLAAQLNLPAETVQKLVAWEAAIADDEQKKTQADRADILQKWTDRTKEILGPSYQREICRALEAVDRFGGPQLRELLEVTGLGNHPVIVKTFQQISAQIGEDISVSGRTRHQIDKTFAEALYGKE